MITENENSAPRFEGTDERVDGPASTLPGARQIAPMRLSQMAVKIACQCVQVVALRSCSPTSKTFWLIPRVS